MSDDRDPNFRLGAWMDATEPTCGFSPTPEVDGTACGEAATVHLWFGSFDDPEASCGMSCPTHANYSIAHAYDWHELGDICGAPNTVWINAAGITGQSWCFQQTEESAAAELTLTNGATR